jgi:hypothetical protein
VQGVRQQGRSQGKGQAGRFLFPRYRLQRDPRNKTNLPRCPVGAGVGCSSRRACGLEGKRWPLCPGSLHSHLPTHPVRAVPLEHDVSSQRCGAGHYYAGWAGFFSHGPILSFSATEQWVVNSPRRRRRYECLTVLWPERWRITPAASMASAGKNVSPWAFFSHGSKKIVYTRRRRKNRGRILPSFLRDWMWPRSRFPQSNGRVKRKTRPSSRRND